MARFLPDANILINAMRGEAPAHEPCRCWLETALEDGDTLLFCELVEVALLRVPTLPKLNFLSMPKVLFFWTELQEYPFYGRVSPGDAHARIFSRMVTNLNLVGNDVNDAWLAALAIEHRAILVSMDAGFGRFPNLDWLNPLSL